MSPDLTITLAHILVTVLFFGIGGTVAYGLATQEERARKRARADKQAQAEKNLDHFLDQMDQRQDGRW